MISPVRLMWPRMIEFGSGKIGQLLSHLEGSGKIFFICDSPVRRHIDPLVSELRRSGSDCELSTDIIYEPPFEALESLLQQVRKFDPQVVVGVGGGSAMDLSKLVAVLLDGSQGIEDIIGIDNVNRRDVTLITVSTTSGTGSEVTPIAVLTDEKNKLKKGVVSPHLIPDIAIVDPDLTISVPPDVTAATGMDAMTHCIEAFTNRHAHPVIDNIALDGIRLISANLETAVSDGANLEARTAMALGSMYGGLCLGPVNTAAVHAMAYPLGGEFKISHGVSNSVLLPYVMNFNLPACTEKYARVAVAMGLEEGDSVVDTALGGIRRIREISKNCRIPDNLKDMGIPESSIRFMAESALKVTRLMENNPREITLDDAQSIFHQVYEGKIAGGE